MKITDIVNKTGFIELKPYRWVGGSKGMVVDDKPRLVNIKNIDTAGEHIFMKGVTDVWVGEQSFFYQGDYEAFKSEIFEYITQTPKKDSE